MHFKNQPRIHYDESLARQASDRGRLPARELDRGRALSARRARAGALRGERFRPIGP